jgi:hypothetical protein
MKQGDKDHMMWRERLFKLSSIMMAQDRKQRALAFEVGWHRLADGLEMLLDAICKSGEHPT